MTEKTAAKKRSGMFWVMIGCGGLLVLGVPILGIMAAIAIPAFLRYIKQSKAAEATAMTRVISSSAISYYSEHCAFPPSAGPSGEIPTNGGKTLSTFQGTGWEAFPLSESEAYFAYHTVNYGDTFGIYAVADFIKGDPMHTLQVPLSGDPASCEAVISGNSVTNEFE